MTRVLEENWNNLLEEHLQMLIDDNYAEGYKIEYKREFVGDIAKSVASFANTHGGWIIIGMGEDKKTNVANELSPCDLTNNPKGTLQDRCSLLDPLAYFESKEIYTDKENNKGFLVVRVPESYDTPHFYKGRVYVRDGVKNEPIFEENRHNIENLIERRKEYLRDLISWYDLRQNFLLDYLFNDFFGITLTFIPTYKVHLEYDAIYDKYASKIKIITNLQRLIHFQDGLLFYNGQRPSYTNYEKLTFTLFTNGSFEYSCLPDNRKLDEMLRIYSKHIRQEGLSKEEVRERIVETLGFSIILYNDIEELISKSFKIMNNLVRESELPHINGDFYFKMHCFNTKNVSVIEHEYLMRVLRKMDIRPPIKCFEKDIYIPRIGMKRLLKMSIIGETENIVREILSEFVRASMAGVSEQNN